MIKRYGDGTQHVRHKYKSASCCRLRKWTHNGVRTDGSWGFISETLLCPASQPARSLLPNIIIDFIGSRTDTYTQYFRWRSPHLESITLHLRPMPSSPNTRFLLERASATLISNPSRFLRQNTLGNKDCRSDQMVKSFRPPDGMLAFAFTRPRP